ncbi:uncharacterized protein [Miscanthus floridulus]|uniref:uncharacterized protein n=1 Tax=Miscanthus floridulus TaxID=154761 RepID=UPI003457A4DD
MQFKQLDWSVQQCQFQSSAKALLLAQYDLIVGMDWLSRFSPMKVDWNQKWLKIPYGDTPQLLQGELQELPTGTVIQVSRVSADMPLVGSLNLPLEISQLLQDFQSVFQPPAGYPPPRNYEHDIPLLPGATPVLVHPYRYPPAVKDEIERQITEMLNSGIIQHSQSPFSSSVLLVKKKDGTFWFCVDFRQLNAITVKTKYPVPVIEELLDELHGASWFTSLDLAAGYHQIRLKPGEEVKTAFQTHMGHYEFRVMAFGLSGAPATFLKAMNLTLGPLLRKCVLVFFDDILIFSHTYEEHVQHVRQVLELLHQDQWQVKMSKCVFAQRELKYLGHVISASGVATDPEKVKAVVKWATPTLVKDLRSFLGLAGYYRRFVKHFGILVHSLTDLLKKGAIFIWSVVHQEAFSALKHAITSAPVLGLPDFSKPFVLETDASDMVSHYTLADGLIRYKGRLWIGAAPVLQHKLIQAMHSTAIGGHSGIPVTYRRMKQHFAWSGMKAAFGVSPADEQPVTDLTSWLQDRSLMSEVIHQHLLRAKQRMKKLADGKRSERQFEINDWVFLKLQPYVQSSLADRTTQKLAFKFFGPFKILSKVGNVAYRLELPATSAVHPVFHVSQLKKVVGARHDVTPSPPPASIRWSIPERILQRRQIQKGARLIHQGLVQWSNIPVLLATWEDLEYLRQ